MENDFINTIIQFHRKVLADYNDKCPSLKETDPNFFPSTYWLHFCIASQKVARAASKITISFSNPPFPPQSEAHPLFLELTGCYDSLLSCFLSLPKDQGAQLSKAVQSAVNSIQMSLVAFLSAFICAITESRSFIKASPLGPLLEECEQITKLPRDNKEAVIKCLEVADSLISDLVDEVTEELRNQINLQRSVKMGVVSEDIEVWSESEVNVVQNALTLAKLAKTALGCAQGYLAVLPDTSINNRMLDDLAGAALNFSPDFDDFLCSLYPPVDDPSQRLSPNTVSGNIDSFLNMLQVMPGLSAMDAETCKNISKEVKNCCDQMRILLVSNEIMELSLNS